VRPVMDGRRHQWLAFDAMFFGNRVTLDLLERFGPAGVLVWIAFLCACKRATVPGTVSVLSDADALGQLGLTGLALVDNAGDKWELADLWKRLGQLKQMSRRRRGQTTDIVATRWEQWQYTAYTQVRAERKSRSRDRITGPYKTRQDKDMTETRQGNDETVELAPWPECPECGGTGVIDGERCGCTRLPGA
jgi:hypothetical protein